MIDATPAVTRGSATLVWTLVARSLGLAAGIAVALLIGAALLRAS
jgi:hypothetical protein